jgi:hypothetical protein
MPVVQSRVYSATLQLTIGVDREIYGLSDTLEISGNLTFNGNPVGNGIVAIEILDPHRSFYSFRTVQTGPTPPSNWPVNYTELYPSDSDGKEQHMFSKGATVSLFYRIKNFDVVPHYINPALSIYSPSGIPIGAWIPTGFNVPPDTSLAGLFPSVTFETAHELGTYTIYGSAYSDLPFNLGRPYCLERVATFTLTGAGSGNHGEAQRGTDDSQKNSYPIGYYASSFKLPRIGQIGTYIISVSSYYQGQEAFSNIGVPVVLIGDINNDGMVEMMDFFFMSQAYGSTPQDPNWNPKCDIYTWPYGDGSVELMDFFLISNHYGDQVGQQTP